LNFNGDRRPDIVVGSLFNNEDSNELDLFPGNGDGTFGPVIITKLNARPQDLSVADVNGDGIPDVALITHPQAPNEGPSLLWLFLGTKAGPLRLIRNWPLPGEPKRVFLADFDGNGKLDMGVSDSSPLSFRSFPVTVTVRFLNRSSRAAAMYR
jgi:hypothetical protein